MNKANKEHKFKVGDRVRCTYKFSRYYPPIGTIGTVLKMGEDNDVRVQWEKGTTPSDGCWFALLECIESVVEEPNLTDEEIWEMLQPKMKKIGMVSPCSRVEIRSSDIPFFSTNHLTKQYNEEDVQRAIATAYRSGYGRAMKGRPFKIGSQELS